VSAIKTEIIRELSDWCEARSQEAEMVRVVVGEVAALVSLGLVQQISGNSSDI
jgi:hypothetical protein